MPRPQTHPYRPKPCGLVTDTNSTVGAVVPDAPLAVPSCPGSATAANTPSPVGAGSQGTLAGYPARDTLRDHLCLAMAANFPPSVGAGLQGTLAGYPARRNIARLPLSRDGREYSPIRRGGACPARRRILAARNFADW